MDRSEIKLLESLYNDFQRAAKGVNAETIVDHSDIGS